METTNKINSRDIFWSAISYLGVLVILPFSLQQRSDFIKHHLRQGLALLVAEIIFTFIFVIPFLGWMLGCLGWLLCCLFSLIGFISALNKKYWKLPLFLFLASKFKLS